MLIRDGKGEIYNKVKEPAVVFDNESGTIYKIGEYKVMKTYHQDVVKTYDNAGFKEMGDSLCLLELPRKQELIDKIFQNTGYLKIYYKSLFIKE